LRLKLHSETQMARFFERNDIAYERDAANRIDFLACPRTAPAPADGRCYSRPDFFLPEFSARLGALVIVCNDEFAHRRYACEFQRIFHTVNALCARDGDAATRVLFVRVNPHFHFVGSRMYDVPLAETHTQLLAFLQRLQPADMRDGVSLAFLGYDRTNEGTLCLLEEAEEADQEEADEAADTDEVCSIGEDNQDRAYMDLYRDCVIHVA
jgi:hypothetical protein